MSKKELLCKIEDIVKRSGSCYMPIQSLCLFEDIEGLEEAKKMLWQDLEYLIPEIISFIEKYKTLPQLPDNIVKSIEKSLARGYAFYGPANDWACEIADFPEDKIAIEFLEKCENKEDYLDAILVKAYYLKK